MRTKQTKEERRAINKLAVELLRGRRWLAGRCRLCPKPRKSTSSYCDECTKAESAKVSERRRRRRERAAAAGGE
jgi:hypothetical protein